MKTRVAAINKEIGKWQTKKQNKADGAGKIAKKLGLA